MNEKPQAGPIAISIAKAKSIREELGLQVLVLIGVDAEGRQHVATHGKTRTDAVNAAVAGNRLKAAMGWPAHMCEAKPVERICANCAFWRADSRSISGTRGHCHLYPNTVGKAADSTCAQFEPRG